MASCAVKARVVLRRAEAAQAGGLTGLLEQHAQERANTELHAEKEQY